MITDAEYELVQKRISKDNSILTGTNFTFDLSNNEIKSINTVKNYPQSRMYDVIDHLRVNMLKKYQVKRLLNTTFNFLP